MDEKSLKPQLRFKGFADAWEQRKYEDLGEPLSGGTLNYDSLNENGSYKCVLYGELYTRYDCVIKDVFYRTNQKGNTIFRNDILFPQSTTVDALSLISPACLNDETAETSGVFVIRPKKEIDGNFVAYYTKGNPNQRYRLSKKAQGLTIVHLYYQSIKDEQICIPSYPEQKQISSLFLKIDNLITLHQRKQKSIFYLIMQRISTLTNPWEQRKLDDVAKYRNGKAHENNITDDGRFIVVNSKFVSTDGNVQKYSDIQIEPLYKDELAFVLSDVPNGRAIARTYLIEKDNKYTLNQRIAGITPNKNTFPYFLHILMNRNKYFLQFDDGAKQTNLSVSDVKNFDEYYPSFFEQSKIGNLFSNLDNLITLHQRKHKWLNESRKRTHNNIHIFIF